MLGMLPQTLKINGSEYKIRSDYRDILQIIAAFGDKELTDEEKAYVCMRRLFVAMNTIPKADYVDAYKAAIDFIECHISDKKPSPKVVNWEKDEQLIFPAINKVAGMEVRAVPYMHWWTFLAYFDEIGEGIFSFVVGIRKKQRSSKKLEKHEQQFYRENKELVDIHRKLSKEEQQFADYIGELL